MSDMTVKLPPMPLLPAFWEMGNGFDDTDMHEYARSYAIQAVLEERERNAKLCQENEVWMSADKGMVLRPNLPIAGHEHVGFAYAAAIRAQPEPEA